MLFRILSQRNEIIFKLLRNWVAGSFGYLAEIFYIKHRKVRPKQATNVEYILKSFKSHNSA